MKMNRMLGDALRNLRENRGLTQMELAQEAEVATPYLSAVENGYYRISFAKMCSILEALGVSGETVIKRIFKDL